MVESVIELEIFGEIVSTNSGSVIPGISPAAIASLITALHSRKSG